MSKRRTYTWLRSRVYRRRRRASEDRRRRQANTLGGVTGELDEFLRRDAVRLVQRHGEAELLVVLGDDCRPLSEAGIQQCLYPRRRLDFGQLGRHVGVSGTVGLVGDDLNAVTAGDFQAFAMHRLVESSGTRYQRELRQLARAHILEDLLAGHAVGMRRLEDPLLDRLDNDHRSRQRNEGYLRLLRQRNHGHGGPGGRATDDRIDLVLLDK